ncbi:tRNA pseudouridine(38-40) synthase TruA [Corynebacterium aurimucosum]|uniref:tRNA pseudouridine(38-40) synthase TruA n=1 Tax=Corynebacterium TaxID=1716 RepID=UPI001178AB62|nr:MULTISPECIES: tRNA pseudouridine(38-40) synthase TruA [Corynebacterium]MBE7364508.1 tRNA pseudouridine(38-40) synthase TruA [Corynebacterium aurimucosum]TRX33386.1 tRNA pseudouridine(38-40) synthase TruA [Corynebacterium guaraldiae]TRX54207.1 tRNA pseudouridine(38-40) synthase TruA [Corynebacterium guaraldiae]HCT9179777.1 tRNA pseudouridine(38-40) synthase TruA [Corynebacterium aurimucosum]
MTNVRLRLDLAYDGTDFHGWAKQKGGLRTVQQTVEEKLSMVLRHPVELTVAGRTDAGVHASGQVAHLDTTRSALGQRSIDGDPSKLVKRLAKLLPADVRVHACTEVPADFDARFSALRRRYVYRLTTHPRGALPTRARDTATWFKPVDLELMQAAADQLVGLNDFVAFCKAKPHATTIRELLAFEWKDVSTPAEPQLYEAHVTADAFCWSMVRSLVGCCLRVGEGSRGVDFAAQMLREERRSSEIPLADAQGLSLVGVDYPEADQLAARAEMTRGRRAAEDTELG